MFGVSTWGHQILEMREREWLLAYRSSAVRKLSAQQVSRHREKREGEVGARISYVINNDWSQWSVLSDR